MCKEREEDRPAICWLQTWKKWTTSQSQKSALKEPRTKRYLSELYTYSFVQNDKIQCTTSTHIVMINQGRIHTPENRLQKTFPKMVENVNKVRMTRKGSRKASDLGPSLVISSTGITRIQEEELVRQRRKAPQIRCSTNM